MLNIVNNTVRALLLLVVLLTGHTAQAAVGEWTWVAGENRTVEE